MTSTVERLLNGPAAMHEDVSTDATSIHAIFNRHQRDVNRLVHHLLGPDGDHDDIVQDIFVRIISKSTSLRDPSRERAWVTTVAISVVRNHLRSRKVRRIVELHPEPPESAETVEPRLLARDLVRRGYRLLDQLDRSDRIALVLRRVQDRSIEDVASLCGCSRATVKRRVRRAEDHLAEILARDPELYEHLARDGGDR